MDTRGIYNREGESLGYLAGTRLYDIEGVFSGELRGQTIVDTNGERRWMIDGDALLDLRGNVIGYLGQPLSGPDAYDVL